MNVLIVFVSILMQAPACPVDDLSSEGGMVRWEEFEIGMSKGEVIRVLDAPLDLEESFTIGGISWGEVRRNGRRLHLVFRDGEDVLVGLSLIRSEDEREACWSRENLLGRVRSVFPRATYRPSRHHPHLSEAENKTPMYSVDDAGTVVLVKPDRSLYVGSEGVLD